MTPLQAISLFSIAALSLADLRTRLVPLVEILFAAAAFLAFPDNRIHVVVMFLAVLWGIFRRVPAKYMIPFLFYPPSWPALIVGYGVRKKMVGQGDLYVLAIIGLLFPFPATIMALLGFEFWRRFWTRRGKCGLIPALPGLFIGLSVYSLFLMGLPVIP